MNLDNKQKIGQLYLVNDCDYIDVDDIDAIHIDPEKKTMSVLYFGQPIPVTKKTWQRHICKRYFQPDQLIAATKILDF